ncbi:glycosyltransferase family 1 protein [Aestuariivita sp.]|jgi:glycosyltransferase involved in cell wall biosynthesis|uniref:glycosyltransferase family 4 protein n=1 Tax=Aestuariivita sp. TaxID=1872407 RepID=UPI0021708FC9|nr:glycosyltransferase family 1 protein [Aestuariivita sp.]MCE8009013.1 glycosyltransferase family 1 protein [Aestuariivita sp.]
MTSVLFVTDAWRPQINGVMRTLEHTIQALERIGIRSEVLGPDGFTTLPCPTYPDIRLALTTRRRLSRMIAEADCAHVHIATEGPLGLLAGSARRRHGQTYTTSYHTRFPEYIAARAPVPVAPLYAWLRRFHNRGSGCMVATESLHSDLAGRGFRNLMRWPRGVDTDLFRPMAETGLFADLPRPIWLNVGRVAVEKNLPAFLGLDLPGTKVVVGDGPHLPQLRRRYPQTRFVGAKSGAELARHYAAADVFVFPSRTDTFGMVMLEALAAGLPVAAFPVMGPRDVIAHGRTGMLSEDLGAAALAARDLSRAECRTVAESRGWSACTEQFVQNLSRAEPATVA